MKNITLFATLLTLAVSANSQAGLKGIGFDGQTDQATVRLGISEFANVELGLGMQFDDAQAKDTKFGLGVSGTFLGHLQHWTAVDNYFYGGLNLKVLPQPNDNVQVWLLAGLQPEITLMEHLAVSIRCGLQARVAPDFLIGTSGEQVSIVNSLRFTLLF